MKLGPFTINSCHTTDALAGLRSLQDGCVQCIVTSPPYWGLRSYLKDDHADKALELGSEKTPQEYIKKMVEVFRECRRVLRDDGVMWVNIGDSYAANRGYQVKDGKHCEVGNNSGSTVPTGLKPKDLVGIPWMLAFALRDDGWYLRRDVIWAKPNPMPESVTDRPTTAHEYVFLFSKSQRYFYDAEAVKEPNADAAIKRYTKNDNISTDNRKHEKDLSSKTNRAAAAKRFPKWIPGGRNLRSVWTIPTQSYSEAHFATFPEALAKRCILAGTREGGDCIVLDPFIGSGTVGMVCERIGRSWIGFDLNPEYEAMQRKRTAQAGLFSQGGAF